MDLYATALRLAALEAGLAQPEGWPRLEATVELAWHLRQRDSARALALADTASRALGRRPRLPREQSLVLRLALTRCELAALFGRTDEAEHWLAKARDHERADPHGATDVLLAEALVAKSLGQRARTREAYERCVHAAEHGVDSARAAAARAWLALDRAYHAPTEVEVKELPLKGGPSLAADALHHAAQAILLSRREPARAVGLYLRASELAQQVGLVREAVVMTLNAGTTLRGLGDQEQAAACFDISESVARQTGWPYLVGTSGTQLGAYLSAQGRLEEARQVLVAAMAELAAIPSGITRANACLELGLVLLRLDRAVEAVDPVNEAIRMYRAEGSLDNLALALLHKAVVLSATGDLDPALAVLREGEALIEEHAMSVLRISVSEALAEIHRRHRLPAPPGLQAPTPAAHYAELALAQGRAVAGWKPPAAMLAALADDWARAGQLEQAWNHARQALSLMREEAAWLARPASHYVPLHSAQAAPPLDLAGLWHPQFRRPPAAGGLLTPSELKVLQMLARGYSNMEISSSLAISEQTVKWHLKKIFGKLDVGSRKLAVTRARALGVVAVAA